MHSTQQCPGCAFDPYDDRQTQVFGRTYLQTQAKYLQHFIVWTSLTALFGFLLYISARGSAWVWVFGIALALALLNSASWFIRYRHERKSRPQVVLYEIPFSADHPRTNRGLHVTVGEPTSIVDAIGARGHTPEQLPKEGIVARFWGGTDHPNSVTVIGKQYNRWILQSTQWPHLFQLGDSEGGLRTDMGPLPLRFAYSMMSTFAGIGRWRTHSGHVIRDLMREANGGEPTDILSAVILFTRIIGDYKFVMKDLERQRDEWKGRHDQTMTSWNDSMRRDEALIENVLRTIAEIETYAEAAKPQRRRRVPIPEAAARFNDMSFFLTQLRGAVAPLLSMNARFPSVYEESRETANAKLVAPPPVSGESSAAHV